MTQPRRELPYDWKDVRKQLQKRVPEIVEKLLGHRVEVRGALIMPLNPRRRDRRPGSFVIWAEGNGAGAFKDYATADVRGDIIDLIIFLGRLESKMDAYWWALDFLHLGKGQVRTTAQAQQDREAAELDRQAAEAKHQADEEGRSAFLFKLWLGLVPIAGTPAEHYLREVRGLDLSRLKHMPGALRWAAAVDGPPDPQTGEVKTWRNVMVAAMTRGAAVTALHRTYLLADGSGKAPIARPKMMIGPSRGAAIRLSSGASGLSPTVAAKRGIMEPLILGEGIETVLTGAIARPDYRAWAAGSIDHMALIAWPPCVSGVILLKENDAGPESRDAFARAVAHWQAQAKGRPVKAVAPRSGSDINEFLMAS